MPPPPDPQRFAIEADPVRAGLVIARTAQRVGELEVAETTLAELHAAHPAHPEVAGAYARLLVTQARYQEARDVAMAGGPLAGLRAEAAGLAMFQLGELEGADAAFAALEVEAATAGHGAQAGRATLLRGMVVHQRGQLGLASERYREAARRLTEVGERQAAAAALLDLGAVLVERGRAGEALAPLASASSVLAELGSATEACVAELHRSSALLVVGEVEGARAAAEAALARTAEAPQLRARALTVAGDACKRLGDEPAALRHYREALAVAALRDDARGQLRAHVALAEAGQRDSDGVAVDALCATDDDRARWTLARGRLALWHARPADPPPDVARDADAGARGDPSGDLALPDVARDAGARGDPGGASSGDLAPPDVHHVARDAGARGDPTGGSPEAAATREVAALARACAAVAVRAVDEDRLERAFRGHAIAAQLAQRAGEAELARGEAGRARLAYAALVAATTPAFRAVLDGDPDVARLPGEPVAPRRAEPRRDAPVDDEAALPAPIAPQRRLLALSRRVHTEASLERIFDEVIDAAIELSGAERGCLLLRRPDGALAIAVARNWFAEAVEVAGPGSAGAAASERSPSRVIAERVAQTGETVIAMDPALQPRSGGGPRVRSVLAVPLRQRGAITGSLYVDHRLRSGAFDAPTAAVLGELADLAAIAIENARRLADLRRACDEADERNAHLVAELAAREAELERATAALASAQAAAQAGPAGPVAPVAPAGDDLRLRPVLAATERVYIAAAMARANGNQTAAARLLGLSRFGLQKKLRRQSTDATLDGALDDDPDD